MKWCGRGSPCPTPPCPPGPPGARGSPRGLRPRGRGARARWSGSELCPCQGQSLSQNLEEEKDIRLVQAVQAISNKFKALVLTHALNSMLTLYTL